jgi:XTP/dITP diphosphohydrolase
MRKKLLIATNNEDKIKEIKDMLRESGLDIKTLADLKIKVEVEEDKDSLEGNALKKAEEMWKKAKIPCSADDTGLFVDALDGAPGVFAARYAGENVTYKDNRRKLLRELEGVPTIMRTAYFRTAVCYYYAKGKYELFDGVCEGKIILEERGDSGFGYDAIFLPNGYYKTFAELDIEEKNRISHRAKAFNKFKDYILKKNNNL